jgi:hypothetical protein
MRTKKAIGIIWIQVSNVRSDPGYLKLICTGSQRIEREFGKKEANLTNSGQIPNALIPGKSGGDEKHDKTT